MAEQLVDICTPRDAASGIETQSASLNIVIPVYNEGPNIGTTLTRISECMQAKSAEVATTLTIVYDFDEDNTLPVVEALRPTYPLPIRLQKNTRRGVCEAIKQGLLASTSTFVLVTMADMSDEYEKLPSMLDKALEGYDIVCGSRYMRGGHQYGGPLLKKTLSRLAGVSLHWLAGIDTHDVTNSYKLYRRSLLNDIQIESTGGFEIGLEIVVKTFALKRPIAEVPSSWWDRSAGQSRFRLFKWIPLYFKWYLYALKARWI
jgi:dolichol-phosphate mannosyltransferase